MDRAVALFASDPALLSSLRFSLSLEGYRLRSDGEPPTPGECMVIDQAFRGDGLAWLASLRAVGHASPALLLVTHPNRAVRTWAAALGARLIDKPLTGDELTEALEDILVHGSAA